MSCSVDWSMVLQFVAVFLSWPPITLLLAGFLLWILRDQLRALAERIEEWTGFGTSAKFRKQQQQQLPVTNPAAPGEEVPREMLVDALRYESVLNNIYGSQLDFVRGLAERDADLTLRNKFYDEHVARLGKDATSPGSWMQWLLDHELVHHVPGEEKIGIGERGRLFVAHLNRYYRWVPPRIG